jgi:hypothetical protein
MKAKEQDVNRYAVSLLHTKQEDFETKVRLTSAILTAVSKDEAVGMLINECAEDEECKGYSLNTHTIIKIEENK